jgi:hypothetical protein
VLSDWVARFGERDSDTQVGGSLGDGNQDFGMGQVTAERRIAMTPIHARLVKIRREARMSPGGGGFCEDLREHRRERSWFVDRYEHHER